MNIHSAIFRLLLPRFSSLLFLPTICYAYIDGMRLGARYNANASEITFRVYSSRATRIEVYLYGKSIGEEETARYTLSRNAATNVWSRTQSIPLKIN